MSVKRRSVSSTSKVRSYDYLLAKREKAILECYSDDCQRYEFKVKDDPMITAYMMLKRRRELDLTITDIQVLSDVSYVTIHHIESGKRIATYFTMIKVLKGLGYRLIVL